jgi:DNA polymerase-3 subunit epsilon
MTPEALASLLALTRPLIFLDLETTTPPGAAEPDAKVDRIVELGVMKVYPDGRVTQFASYYDPGQPMNPEATKVNGITDDMLAGARPFSAMARAILAGITDSDFAGFNCSRYDRRVLQAEFERCGLPWDPNTAHWVDAYLLWAMLEPRDLKAWVKRVLGVEHEGHRAGADVAAVVAGLPAMLDLWPDLPRTVPELDRSGREGAVARRRGGDVLRPARWPADRHGAERLLAVHSEKGFQP